MKFQKSIMTALAGAVLIATPAVAANASSLPSKSSSYWNQARVVTTTKKIAATEHKVVKKNISKKVLKKVNIKKGAKISVTHVKGNTWKITGIKTPKSTVLTTSQAKTTWMKQVVKKAAAKKTTKVTTNTNKNVPLYAVTKKTTVYGYAVKNNTIQSKKIIKKSTIAKNQVILVRKLNNGQWMLIGGSVPEIKNGIWITKTTKSNWIKRVPVYTTSKKTVPTNDLSTKEAKDAYYALNAPIGTGKTVLKFGDPVKAMKVDDSNDMLVIDGKSYKVAINNNQPYAITSNTLVLKLANGNTGLQSLYNPGDSRVILPKTYTPSNGDQWFEYNQKQGNYKVYVYASSLEGWLFREVYTPKQTTSANTTTSNTTNTNQSTGTTNTNTTTK
ncbi:hypothetical protein DY042_02340 [Apilactobacillus kunkeei]|uniref:hypothetical protein n=1 Tax=Apilactobacillus kunkeei TaxID=148814 RepID=UPI0011297FA9|nr:hypothetical protein [Apilactobacillus kunkeei]MCK8619349.1 hypothetical protein [Apilactobacillus kunkeei]TPR52156.1 hypothetical protein DY042_02340 [Apilactobacillus kunkeei]CAI2653958.1 hypothetical protein AKUA2101_13300 [Apilactobacillus kunkeei]CAI2657294.1 hypothetical protein AKUA1805_13290 [Apilactobacillus kunkeei]